MDARCCPFVQQSNSLGLREEVVAVASSDFQAQGIPKFESTISLAWGPDRSSSKTWITHCEIHNETRTGSSEKLMGFLRIYHESLNSLATKHLTQLAFIGF